MIVTIAVFLGWELGAGLHGTIGVCQTGAMLGSSHTQAKLMNHPPRKNSIIGIREDMVPVPVIKLIRKDTTLDLSQKAKKSILVLCAQLEFKGQVNACWLMSTRLQW